MEVKVLQWAVKEKMPPQQRGHGFYVDFVRTTASKVVGIRKLGDLNVRE